ncbi:MAG: SPFH domain-containing protein [Algisphaera sp.]
MTDDPQAYSRATSAALIGAATQLTFAVIMAGLGLYAQSTGLNAAAWYLFGGLPIWGVLWLLYNQHRLERIEALESQQLAADDARAADLFNEAGQGLATARKRLDGFYKWGLNAVSIGLAIYLIAVGLFLFLKAYRHIDITDDGRNYRRLLIGSFENRFANPWLIVGFCVVLAFVGFLVARYVAGMTRVPAWRVLRGGAAYLIGNVLVILLCGIAALGLPFGYSWGLAALALAVPALMVLLGLETLLAFVFGIYRPRKATEVVRPAFDSRLLGWLTSPDSMGKIVSETLNYQFGFEITRSWFYVLLGKALAPLLAAGLVILFALSSVIIVSPHENAVITHRGQFVRVAQPGVSFKLPWPLGRATKYDVGRSQRLVIGAYEESQRIAGKATLWTNDHIEGKSEYLPTAPVNLDAAASTAQDEPTARNRSSRLGGLVALQAVVTYRIDDLKAYVDGSGAQRPTQLLKALAQRHLSAMVATRAIDDLLGEGRMGAADDLRQRIIGDVQRYALGVDVSDVLLYDIHPPKDGEVAVAFLEQVNALQSQKTDIENAQRDAIGIYSTAAGSQSEALRIESAIRTLSELRDNESTSADEELAQQITINRLIDSAGGEAARVLADARLERWETALGEQAEAARFNFERAAFDTAPDYFRSRYYLDAVGEAFAQSSRRVISTVQSDQPSTLRIDLTDTATPGGLFDSN